MSPHQDHTPDRTSEDQPSNPAELPDDPQPTNGTANDRQATSITAPHRDRAAENDDDPPPPEARACRRSKQRRGVSCKPPYITLLKRRRGGDDDDDCCPGAATVAIIQCYRSHSPPSPSHPNPPKRTKTHDPHSPTSPTKPILPPFYKQNEYESHLWQEVSNKKARLVHCRGPKQRVCNKAVFAHKPYFRCKRCHVGCKLVACEGCKDCIDALCRQRDSAWRCPKEVPKVSWRVPGSGMSRG